MISYKHRVGEMIILLFQMGEKMSNKTKKKHFEYKLNQIECTTKLIIDSNELPTKSETMKLKYYCYFNGHFLFSALFWLMGANKPRRLRIVINSIDLSALYSFISHSFLPYFGMYQFC